MAPTSRTPRTRMIARRVGLESQRPYRRGPCAMRTINVSYSMVATALGRNSAPRGLTREVPCQSVGFLTSATRGTKHARWLRGRSNETPQPWFPDWCHRGRHHHALPGAELGKEYP